MPITRAKMTARSVVPVVPPEEGVRRRSRRRGRPPAYRSARATNCGNCSGRRRGAVRSETVSRVNGYWVLESLWF